MTLSLGRRWFGALLSVGIIVAVLGTVRVLAPSPRSASASHTSEPDQPDPRIAIPTEHATLGSVHHALPGRDVQIAFLSDTPLETIRGRSNQTHGYIVLDADLTPRAGAWQVPVAELRTGLRTRDEHLLRAEWLDAAAHPFIRFDLERVVDVEPVDDPAAVRTGARTISCTLIGTMQIKGTSRELIVPNATITALPADVSPSAAVVGELAALRARFEIHLADFGITHRMIATDENDRGKVSPIIAIELTLVHATVPPEDQPGSPARGKPTLAGRR